jgi:2-oxoglutarate ferredoxin oxidoreductase subunit beta
MVTVSRETTEALVYKRPQALADVHTHYCPGCTHGTAHRLVAEIIDELTNLAAR